MDPADAQQVTRIVAGAYNLIERVLQEQLHEVAEQKNSKRRVVLDEGTSRAVNNWQRTASGLIASHPGLLELTAKTVSGEGESETDKATRLAQVFGLDKPKARAKPKPKRKSRAEELMEMDLPDDEDE